LESQINGAFERAPAYIQRIVLKAINSREEWNDTPRMRDLLAFELVYQGW